MSDTKRNYALKALSKAITGGTIIKPDEAVNNTQQSVLQEVAILQVLRDDLVKAMVQGLAGSIASGKVGASNAADLVASADAFACELMRLKCEEVEGVNAVTGGSRSAGFEYLSNLLGVERQTPAVKDAPVVNLHG